MNWSYTNHRKKWYFSGEVVFGCGKAHGRGNALNRVLGKGQDGLTLVSPNGAAILGTVPFHRLHSVQP